MGDAKEFKLDAKGRGVVPRAVRQQAGFTDGSQLIVRAVGYGRVVIESRDAIQQRVWDAAPDDSVDAATATREDRRRDADVSDRNFERRRGRDALGDADPEAGKRLLEMLDL